MVGMERVACCRLARSQSLAFAGTVDGNSVRQWSPYGDDLAQGRRGERRLPRLLLLPFQCGTQQQIDRHATGNFGTADFAVTGASAVGHRRLTLNLTALSEKAASKTVRVLMLSPADSSESAEIKV
jgi:hypothetical protein